MSLRSLRTAIAGWSPQKNATPDPLAAVIAAWPAIVGSGIARQTRPAEVSRDTLLIVTRSSAWSQQLSLLSDDVLRGVHGIPELQHITRLRFRVGKIRGGTHSSVATQSSPRHARTTRSSPPADATAQDLLQRLRANVSARRRASPSCPVCGAPRTAPGPCAPCVAGPVTRRAATTQRLMYDAPWLGYRGIAQIVDGLGRDEYDRLRNALLARWWEILVRARWTKHVTSLERRVASSYVLLQSGLEPDRITPAVVRNLLGDDIAALLDGAANGAR